MEIKVTIIFILLNNNVFDQLDNELQLMKDYLENVSLKTNMRNNWLSFTYLSAFRQTLYYNSIN